jgi:di/tricarboxylate transporter
MIHTPEQFTVVGILVATFVLFARNKWRHDVVAVISLVLLVTADLILEFALGRVSALVKDPGNLLSGFGHPAVLTVGAVLVISRALRNAGVVDIIARSILPLTKSESGHIFSLSTVVMVCSAFMNNVGALALMLPVALRTAAERARPPGMILMPLAFASILGGMMTLIGTPPNIIIATMRAELIPNAQPYGLFDFSPVGAVVAIAGVAFVALIGWRLIPKASRTKPGGQALFRINEYVTELRVPEECGLIGQTVGEFAKELGQKLELIGFVNKDDKVVTVDPDGVLEAGNRFLAKADPVDLQEVLDLHGLRLAKEIRKRIDNFESDDLGYLEAIVSRGSLLEGRGRSYLRRRMGRGVVLLAIARQGEPIRKRLDKVVFRVGDVLLLHGDAETMDDRVATLNLLPLAEREVNVGSFQKAGLALLVFAAAIGLSAAGVLPMTIAFVGAALAYVLLGILPTRDIYREIDWPVIVLLAAMMPLSQALRDTGCAELVAKQMALSASSFPHWVIIAIVMGVTMCLSDVINNAATALIMAPIAAGIAIAMNLNPDPFLMSVAVGASCAFLTPIGHQCNALVLGPGGYRFGDYWRMGLPLEIMILAAGTPLILNFWPLT